MATETGAHMSDDRPPDQKLPKEMWGTCSMGADEMEVSDNFDAAVERAKIRAKAYDTKFALVKITPFATFEYNGDKYERSEA
jgi:hypothetical protein